MNRIPTSMVFTRRSSLMFLFTGKITGKKEQGSFKKGKREGAWVSYHDNGRIRDKGDYKDGKMESHWVMYHYNGQLGKKGDYKNGQTRKERGMSSNDICI